jgi:chemotaxis family two-component system response regulator Rcp1
MALISAPSRQLTDRATLWTLAGCIGSAMLLLRLGAKDYAQSNDLFHPRDALEDSSLRLDITVIGDGAQAIDFLLRRDRYADDGENPAPDVVLLDLNLPKMSGHQVLIEARKMTGLRTLPIIVLTSSDAGRDIVLSYALGANCCVTKPGDLVAFQTMVRAVGDFWCRVAKLA